MPKPLKKPADRKFKTPPKPKRPTDPNRAAHSIMAEHKRRTSEPESHVVRVKVAAPVHTASILQSAKVRLIDPVPSPAQVSAYMRQIGAKGGKVSGAKRMTNLSDEQRQEIASKAARARWKSAKKGS